MLEVNNRFSPINIIVFTTFIYEARRAASLGDPNFKLHHYFSSCLYTRQLHNSSAISFCCPMAMFKYFFQHLIGDMKHTWKHNRTFSGVWRLFSGWKSVYDTAVYMIDTNICKMFPEMFDPADAIIAYLWLAIWWIGYLSEIISRHKEGTYHGFWLYSDRLFNVKSLLRMSQPVL